MVLCVNTQERGRRGKFLRMRMGIVCLDREGGQVFYFIAAILHIPLGNYTHY